jgi:hypothetical protein
VSSIRIWCVKLSGLFGSLSKPVRTPLRKVSIMSKVMSYLAQLCDHTVSGTILGRTIWNLAVVGKVTLSQVFSEFSCFPYRSLFCHSSGTDDMPDCRSFHDLSLQ